MQRWQCWANLTPRVPRYNRCDLWTNAFATFIERAKKRIGCCRDDVARAQNAFAQTEAKFQSKENNLAENEHTFNNSHRGIKSERLQEEIASTVQANFANELAQLRF